MSPQCGREAPASNKFPRDKIELKANKTVLERKHYLLRNIHWWNYSQLDLINNLGTKNISDLLKFKCCRSKKKRNIICTWFYNFADGDLFEKATILFKNEGRGHRQLQPLEILTNSSFCVLGILGRLSSFKQTVTVPTIHALDFIWGCCT